MTHATPNDWFSEVKRYLQQNGAWDDRFGPVPIHPDTKVPAEVRAKFKIEIDPDLGKPRKANGRTTEAPASTVASVAFMITNAMKAELRARGYTDAQIADMTPEAAHKILDRDNQPDIAGPSVPKIDKAQRPNGGTDTPIGDHPIIPPEMKDELGVLKLRTEDLQNSTATNEPQIIITLDAFLAKFDPPDYLIDGLLQKHFLYSLTGMTGGGKTAVAVFIAVLVALRKFCQKSGPHTVEPNQIKFGPHAVEPGRVIYIAAENETDVQMRFPPLLTRFKVKATDLDILVIDQVIDLEKDYPRVERNIRAFGDVDLIIVDTSPRLFLGDNMNDDAQMLKHAVRLRKLTRLPGKPCVLALGHPIKRPQNPEDLLPKGGGAYLNEMDGNLTLWKHDGNLTDLHTTGKFRGPDFPPVTFRLDVAYSTANRDTKGRALPTVTASHVTEADAAAVEANAEDQEDQLLSAVQAKPRGSLADWATACGWFLNGNRDNPNKQQAQRVAQRLTKTDPKLLTKNGRGYAITKAGKEALLSGKKAADKEALKSKEGDPSDEAKTE